MAGLFVISGSSGVGKVLLLRSFEKHPDFKLSVSCTTRGMRQGGSSRGKLFLPNTGRV